jgi:glycerol-3-phosphate dehydrogenase
LKRFIESHRDQHYDIAVVGGGITGAAVAYDAASRGFSVALIERRDFGAATSAATSKMIHGGLRYLQNLELSLVRESLKERRILGNIAPNLVYPIPFLLINPNWLIKLGMVLYDLLSFDKGMTWDKSKKIPWHRSLSAGKTIDLAPVAGKGQLKGAVAFYDCVSIFPERLTLAFIKSAVDHGSDVANHAEVEKFLRSDEGRITGVSVRDLIKGRSLDIESSLTINCTGPWTDRVLGIARGESGQTKIRRSQGIHLITRKLLDRYALSALDPRGGRVSLMPWRDHTLVGITDSEYLGDPDDYEVTSESVLELLDSVNRSLGVENLLRPEDVLYAYGGLRPLVGDQDGDLYHTSRKYEIHDNATDGLEGLITVEGGKFTTSRNLAESVVDLAASKLKEKKKSRRCETAKRYLAGCEIADMALFIDRIVRENQDFEARTVEQLGRKYGVEFEEILKIARNERALSRPINDDGEILAQVVHAIRNEMAHSLTDIILRRTGIGTLGNPGIPVLNSVAEVAARELGWDDARRSAEVNEAVKALELPFSCPS